MKIYILLSALLLVSSVCDAQNVLDGVYVMEQPPKYRNGVKLWATINVTVLDSLSKKPIENCVVELFDSKGTSLGTKTNKKGRVRYRTSTGIKGVVSCSNEGYKNKKWEYDTRTLSYPMNFDITIELAKKEIDE